MKNLIKKIFSPRNLGAVIAILIVTGATALAQIPSYKNWLIQGTNLYTTGTNVGIGTANPVAKLHVDGFLRVSGGSAATVFDTAGTSFIEFRHSGTSGRVIGSDRLSLETSGVVRQFIDLSGNVGIGTTNPTEKLQAAGIIHSTTGGFKFPDGTVQTTRGISGSGSVNRIPRFTGSTSLGDSPIIEIGSGGVAVDNTLFVGGFGATSPAAFVVGGNFSPVPVLFAYESTGRVGINTLNPQARLEVRDGLVASSNSAGSFRSAIGHRVCDPFNPFNCGDVGGFQACHGPDCFTNPNEVTILATTPVNLFDRGYIAVFNNNFANPPAGMYVNAAGQGIVFGNVKAFREPNPNDPNTDIWYASVEGPEAAAYIRGTGQLVNGSAVITFPDHFKAVAGEVGMTVQLTPLSADSKGLAVLEKSLEGVVVRELLNGSGTYDFDWEVKAVRKGHENYRVIRPKDEVKPAVPAQSVSSENSKHQ